MNNENFKLEVDSQQALYILTKFSKNKGTGWVEFDHTNSGELEKIRDAETTSHIFGYYKKQFKKQGFDKPFTFLIAKNLDYEKDKKSLGERFFYGVEKIDFSIESEFSLQDKIYINPVNAFQSKIKIDKGKIKIDLADDLVITGSAVKDELKMISADS